MIRVGVLLDSLTLKAWQQLTLQEIQKSDFARIEVLVLNDGKGVSRSRSFPFFLYRAYSRLDRIFFKPALDPFADTKLDTTTIPVLEVSPVRTLHADAFTEADLEKIRSFNLDVLIRFGFRILKGDILHLARYGVWSYHHGDTREFRGGPPGFWEVLENHPVTGSTLQVLNENLDGGTILSESFSITHPTSVARNRANYYWKTAFLIPRKLKELHNSGEKKFYDRVKKLNDQPSFYSKRLYSNPRNTETVKAVSKHVLRNARRVLSDVFSPEQWILLYRFQKDFTSSMRQFKKIVPGRDRFWADPFPVRNENKYFVFLEEYLYSPKKGHISVMEIHQDGTHSIPQKVLEKPYHLSYPFVFEHEGDLYMVPETASNRTVELYRCVEFPGRWEFVKNLLENITARDATLLLHENRWWMFANVTEHKGISPFDELFLFHAEDLFGEWKPHPSNPVVSDCRSARPAGRLFHRNGKLYRPSQNCSWRYGYGIHINEVTTLTIEEYQERIVESIEPLWEPRVRRVHTLNTVEGFTVMDAAIRRC